MKVKHTNHVSATYNGLPVQTQHGELDLSCLNRIENVLNLAVDDYKRVFAFRVDLRLPVDYEQSSVDNRDDPLFRAGLSSNVISRFNDSFASQIKHDLYSKEKLGKRIYSCLPRFLWCKECDTSINDHFHVLVLLNKDAYFTIGSFVTTHSIYYKVVKAWTSALRVTDIDKVRRLVHFPENPTYYINQNSDEYKSQFEDLFFRVSYFAKLETKKHGNRQRNYGGSSR